jgi:hypothetical protein
LLNTCTIQMALFFYLLLVLFLYLFYYFLSCIIMYLIFTPPPPLFDIPAKMPTPLYVKTCLLVGQPVISLYLPLPCYYTILSLSAQYTLAPLHILQYLKYKHFPPQPPPPTIPMFRATGTHRTPITNYHSDFTISVQAGWLIIGHSASHPHNHAISYITP